NWSSKTHGWLIEDSPKEITVLDWYGELHKLRKAAADEKRPKIEEEKGGGILLSKAQGADYSVAWRGRREDVAAETKKFLADGLPKDEDGGDIFAGVRDRFGLAGHAVEAARFAHYAHLLGDQAQAAALYVHARKAQKKYSDQYGGPFQKA